MTFKKWWKKRPNSESTPASRDFIAAQPSRHNYISKAHRIEAAKAVRKAREQLDSSTNNKEKEMNEYGLGRRVSVRLEGTITTVVLDAVGTACYNLKLPNGLIVSGIPLGSIYDLSSEDEETDE